MNFSRRKFLKTSTLATAAGLGACQTDTQENVSNAYSKTGTPLVISTWKQPAANAAALVLINQRGRALDAVEAGVRVPEADPNDTSVGYGGRPDRDGHVTLDACIMDENGNAGSVTFMQGIKHAISVARCVMEKTPHVMLSGDGATQFALQNGFKTENLLTEASKKAWEEWLKTAQYKPIANIERHDTIGMLAIDQAGNISGACTTSGMAYKLHGRVGDSPIIGAGMFVDNEIGGACATGVGELVMRTLGSFLAVELMRQGKTPQQAAEEVIRRIAKKLKPTDDIQVGILAINKKGEHGAYSLQSGFNYTLSQNNSTRVLDAVAAIKNTPSAQ